MISRTVVALALMSLAAPAYASVGLVCEGDGVSVSLPLAGGVGTSLLGATIAVGDKTWSTDTDVAGATPIASVQSYGVDDRFGFDFSDPQQEAIVAEVRLFAAQEDSDPVFGGTLRVVGVGVWPLSCTVG